jgi:hypothetical protein
MITKVRINWTLDKDIIKKLKTLKTGKTSMSRIVEVALQQYFERNK